MPLGCRPGPHTVLSEEEESQIVEYVINMANIGFGLTREDVMQLAYKVVEKIGKQHPFLDGSAGWSWFEAFHTRHPKFTFHTPQPLSYCRALCSNIGNSFQSWEPFMENLTSLPSQSKSLMLASQGFQSCTNQAKSWLSLAEEMSMH